MSNSEPQCVDIPLPIVRLNRATLAAGIVTAIVSQQPLITTALFAILLPAVLFGQRWSLIFRLGNALFARQNARAEREDRRLMRFNNSIALILLGLAQVAFLAGAPVAGYALAGMVAVAATVALAGFCVGCYIYFQFKQARFRLAR